MSTFIGGKEKIKAQQILECTQILMKIVYGKLPKLVT